MERFAKLAAQALNTVLESPIQVSDLEIPPNPDLGDFAFPCFKLAKQYRKGPPQVAQQIVSDLKSKGTLPPGIEVSATGPYVNFLAPPQEALRALLGDILQGDGLGSYGSLPSGSRENWVLEYSSPNVAKPFNIYHLRPTALGAALDRIGRFRGFNVTSINHLGDWGLQYGKLAVAFRMFAKELPEQPTIQDLVQIYVKFHQEAEKSPALEDEAREAFRKLEQGDPEVTALWRKCLEISMNEFLRIYDRFGVRFDHIWGESFYKDQLDPLLEDLRKRGLLIESEGAWVVPVTDEQGNELPPCILQKKDGASIYATRDVAAAIYRFERFRFDRMTYIVGQEQKLHFQQVFAVLRKMGFEWAKRCEHVPFGLYRFKDSKMSTRKGNFVTLEEVMELAKKRVIALMDERTAQAAEAGRPESEPISAADKDAIAEAVAIGAIVFHDLSTDPARDIEFDVERVVDFEGETGPYLQYAHTRCVSILRKAAAGDAGGSAGESGMGGASGSARVGGAGGAGGAGGYTNLSFDPALLSKLVKKEELRLVKTLGTFPLHLERALSFAKASQLAHFLIDVTQVFGTFYRECHVLGDDPELTRARLMLVEATRRVLGQGMELLGIPRPERM